MLISTLLEEALCAKPSLCCKKVEVTAQTLWLLQTKETGKKNTFKIVWTISGLRNNKFQLTDNKPRLQKMNN
jgi:hypothetical protein